LFSVTNRLRLSLTILNATAPFLTSLFHRFTNLTSLDLTHFQGDLDSLLSKIPPLKYLTSLNLSHQPSLPAYGLRAFSKQITTLTSLIATNLHSSFNHTDLFLIADCFPLLEELNLDYAKTIDNNNTGYIDGVEALSLALIKLRKLNLDHHYYINYKCVYYLFKNCKFLEDLNCHVPGSGFVSAFCEHKPTMLKSLIFPVMFTPQIIHLLKNLTCIDFSHYDTISDEMLSSIVIADIPLRRIVFRNTRGFSYAGLFSLLSKYCQSIQHLDLECYDLLNDHRVVELSSFLVGLVSVNLGKSNMLTYLSLFALLSKCPSLSEIKMVDIGRRSADDYWIKGDFSVYPQLNSLYLPHNSWLGNKHIKIFAYVFPNLRLLDLRGCGRISARSMVHVLRKFPKINHLNVQCCLIYKIPRRMIFQAPNLKILDLELTPVNDRVLYIYHLKDLLWTFAIVTN
jgi:F-box/leucine-rich repeat protein 2/20